MKYFVTGTDTGVGKTYVTAALTAGLRRSGRSARAVKPIETGWDPQTSDAAALAASSGRTLSDTVWRTFAAPRSPKAAAQHEGASINATELIAWCARQTGDPLFIEGAGGWMVPITDQLRMRDLAIAVADAVIVVGRAGLGTVNHALLTAEAIEQRALLGGVILSRRPDDSLEFARENAAEIAAQCGARVAVFPDDEAAILGWFDGAFDEQPTQRTPLG